MLLGDFTLGWPGWSGWRCFWRSLGYGDRQQVIEGLQTKVWLGRWLVEHPIEPVSGAQAKHQNLGLTQAIPKHQNLKLLKCAKQSPKLKSKRVLLEGRLKPESTMAVLRKNRGIQCELARIKRLGAFQAGGTRF